MQVVDVWRLSTTEFGEQCVMKVSLTLRQRLRAMDSASGMLSKMLNIICDRNLCNVHKNMCNVTGRFRSPKCQAGYILFIYLVKVGREFFHCPHHHVNIIPVNCNEYLLPNRGPNCTVISKLRR